MEISLERQLQMMTWQRDAREKMLLELEKPSKEQWRVIERLPLYEASNLGRIRRIKTQRITKMRVSKTCGVSIIMLYKVDTDPRTKTFYAPPLIAHAWLGPRPPGMQINHINGNKYDHRVANLEYCTQSENIRHAYRCGLNRSTKGLIRHDMTAEQHAEIKRLWATGKMSQVAISKIMKCNNSTISKIVNGRSKAPRDPQVLRDYWMKQRAF